MAFSNKIIDGGDILMYVDGKLLGCATSHSIEISNSTREISCKGSGDWTDVEYGRHSWTGSVDALFNLYEGDGKTRYKDLFSLMINKQTVTIASEYVEGDDTFALSGEAIITSVSKNAADADNASYSVSLQGKGMLGMVGEDLWIVTLPNAANADWVAVVETGQIYQYSDGMKIYLPDGTYALQTVGTSQQSSSVTVAGADTTASAWA
jgi:predicted secreted protein